MAVTFGKLERIIQIPTGNWAATLSEDDSDVGAVTLVAATTYYWSSDGNDSQTMVERLKEALEATGAGTYTVTLGAGENGTGKLTIAVAGGASTFGLHTFLENGSANNAWRDHMGWTADITTDVASFASPNHVQALWLPDRPYYNRYGSGDWGHEIADVSGSMSPSGDVSIQYGQRYEAMPLEWQGLSRNKVRIAAESTTNESLQRTYRNDFLGERSYCAQAGGPLRFYPDADTNGTNTTGMLTAQDLRKHIPDQLRDRAVGWWNIRFNWIVQ